MARSRMQRGRRSLFGLLVLLLLLLLFRLNPFLAGVLPGGGRWKTDPRPDPIRQGVLEILIVRGPEQRPIAGATVRLATLDGEHLDTRSDASGRAQFEGLAPQPHRVDASGESGVASAWSEPARRVTMKLLPHPSRSGRVHGEDGAPRPGVAYLLDDEAQILAEVKVGADGRYSFADNERAVAVCAVPDEGAPGATRSGDIVIGEGEQLYGRLPVPGQRRFDVFALVPETSEDRLIPLRARWTAGDEGTYRGILPKGARAWLVHDGAPYPVGMTLTTPKTSAIEGVVTDAADGPLAGVAVVARPLHEGLLIAPFPDARTTLSDVHGNFRIEPLAEGSYALDLSAAGRARIVIREVATGSSPVPIVMTRGFRIQGRVLDPDGEPVRGADVFALGTPDPDARFPEAHARTTADGRFVLDRIGGDFARLRVQQSGYRDVTMMRVAPNGNTTIRMSRAE